MIRYLYLCVLLVFVSSHLFSQSTTEIELKSNYLWDENHENITINYTCENINYQQRFDPLVKVTLFWFRSGDSSTEYPKKIDRPSVGAILCEDKKNLNWRISEEDYANGIPDSVNIMVVAKYSNEKPMNTPLFCQTGVKWSSIGSIGAGAVLFGIGSSKHSTARSDFEALRDRILDGQISASDQTQYNEIENRFNSGQAIRNTGIALAGVGIGLLTINLLKKCGAKGTSTAIQDTNRFYFKSFVAGNLYQIGPAIGCTLQIRF